MRAAEQSLHRCGIAFKVANMDAKLGSRGRAELTVKDCHTGKTLKTGTLPYLATPVVLSLCEAATLDALRGLDDEENTTVGMRVHLDHVRPTPVGQTVTASALLERVEGRRLTFHVEAQDSEGFLIASGRIVRVVVNPERFMQRPQADTRQTDTR